MRCEEFEEIVREVAAGSAPGEAARAHAAACERCAAVLDRQQELSARLRLLAADAAAQGPPPDLERRLRAAIRARQQTPARRGFLWRCWAAAAAAVLLALAVWPRQTPPAPPREFAGWQGFLPLSPAPFESARVVRVRLPRATLVSLGLPVPPERSGDSIQAEVVYADDGVARAIRLIR